MNNALFPWQVDAWNRVQALAERMPHAILFYGPAGIGKTAFIELLAQSLLCEAPLPDGQPCMQCGSCGWFSQYSHPDYRRIRPEVLEEEGGSADEVGDEPEARKSAKSAKAPSKEIRIDQIRALGDFMNVTTHRQGRRVVVIYPAEAMNTAAANSLLKTLEEPPPNTIILMSSNSLDRLLPTILSRCRKFAMTVPSSPEALAWLQSQPVANAEDLLAEHGGAPLAARDFGEAGEREALEEFLAYLIRHDIDGALKTAERLQKTPVVALVAWMQRWLYDLFSVKFLGRIRYYPRYRKQLHGLAGDANTDELMRMLKAASERRAIANHPLSPRLFIEDMLLDYSAMFK